MLCTCSVSGTLLGAEFQQGTNQRSLCAHHNLVNIIEPSCLLFPHTHTPTTLEVPQAQIWDLASTSIFFFILLVHIHVFKFYVNDIILYICLCNSPLFEDVSTLKHEVPVHFYCCIISHRRRHDSLSVLLLFHNDKATVDFPVYDSLCKSLSPLQVLTSASSPPDYLPNWTGAGSQKGYLLFLLLKYVVSYQASALQGLRQLWWGWQEDVRPTPTPTPSGRVPCWFLQAYSGIPGWGGGFNGRSVLNSLP